MTTKREIMVRAEAFKDVVSVPISLLLTYPDRLTPATCRILFDNEADASKVVVTGNNGEAFYQISYKDQLTEIWIPTMMRGQHWSNSTFTGEPELFFESFPHLSDIEIGEGSIHCYVQLQDNPLFASFDEGNLLSWETPVGQVEATVKTRDMMPSLDSDENVSMLHIKLDMSKHESINDLLIELARYLDNFMWLISLLSKQYVNWQQFHMYHENPSSLVFSVIGYRDPTIISSIREKTIPFRHEYHEQDLLIQLDTLRTEIGQKVFELYTQSSKREIIRQLLPMVILSFTERMFPYEILTIYTALETLVSRESKSDILKSSKAKKLEKAVKDFLNSDELKKKVELDDDELREIKYKVTELKRYPYKTRLLDIFSSIWEQLPDQLGYKLTPQILKERLIEAVNRRNIYIHQGKIDNFVDVFGDVALMRFLISVWILQQLEYPLHEISKTDLDLSNLSWAIGESRK